MTEIRRCKNCAHFFKWPLGWESWPQDAAGVCTALRPNLGPPPNREVSGHDGRDCPSWKEVTK